MKRKDKKEIITYSECRKIKRDDGLVMKTVKEYTFNALLDAIVSRTPNLVAYSVLGDSKESGITYLHLKWYSQCLATFLLQSGVKKGDRVAIMGESCPNWMIAYFATTIIGAVAVPILPDFSSFETNSILDISQPKAIFINTKHYKKIESRNDLMLIRMDDLLYIPSIFDGYDFTSTPGIPLKDKKPDKKLLNTSIPNEEDLASLIFTSGTTGASKGVMLTHKNIIVCADESTDVYIKLRKGAKVLSILPMSHCYEFTIGHLLCLLIGAEIVFLGKPPATTILMKGFREVKPHVILTVPLLIEKIYKSAVSPLLKEDEKIKKLIKNPITRPLVYKTIRRKLMVSMGGRMRFFGIGGAALDKEVEEFLFKAKFPYAPGYGLTETSPLIAASGPRPEQHRLGFIGKVVKHDSVILLDKNEEGIGEIAVKGPNVMKGYYKNEELNKESFTSDGYFKTGDLGFINKEGFLAIKGRVKTMILGPSGENIYPESIESLINNMEYVQESLIVPREGGLLALIKLDLDSIAEKLKLNAEEVVNYAESYIQKLKKTVNNQLSSFSKIDEAELQNEAFERTPTQKIKRFLYTRKKDK